MRPVYLFSGAVLAVIALWGWRLGQPISETDVINHYAERYLRTAADGAQLTDCVARPANSSGIWLVIDCTHPNGTAQQFLVGHQGQPIPHRREVNG